MITAKFGTKKFEVSAKRICTPKDFSWSEELNYEETEVSGRKPTVSIKGVKLIPITFEVILDSRLSDIKKEMNYWKTTLKGKQSKKFIYGQDELGYFFLIKYEVKEATFNSKGEYTKAKIALSFIEDGLKYNKAEDKAKADAAAKVAAVGSAAILAASKVKAAAVKQSGSSSATNKVRKNSTIKPKKNTRWYETAEGALKKSGKSGKAYQKNLTVTYTYSKSGKIVCVNPKGLGWLKIEDVTVIKY